MGDSRFNPEEIEYGRYYFIVSRVKTDIRAYAVFDPESKTGVVVEWVYIEGSVIETPDTFGIYVDGWELHGDEFEDVGGYGRDGQAINLLIADRERSGTEGEQ